MSRLGVILRIRVSQLGQRMVDIFHNGGLKMLGRREEGVLKGAGVIGNLEMIWGRMNISREPSEKSYYEKNFNKLHRHLLHLLKKILRKFFSKFLVGTLLLDGTQLFGRASLTTPISQFLGLSAVMKTGHKRYYILKIRY